MSIGDRAGASLPMETWVVTDDGQHNAFTDLVFWRGWFWLIHVSSPTHFASRKSRLVLQRSRDARHWEEIRRFSGEGRDIRDPKFGIVQDRLFLYALLNESLDPAPYATIAASSGDGLSWTAFQNLSPEGWLLGRPIACGTIWYAPAHRLDSGMAVLLRSLDGIGWTIQGSIHGGSDERADETAIHILDDGRILAATRLESAGSLLGSSLAATLVSTSAPPFSTWTALGRNQVTRLDGPCLFGAGGRIFALGRRQVGTDTRSQRQGSAFGHKRTSLFLIEENRGELVHLADLPSSGDTSYAGAAIVGGKVYISYYTNDPGGDLPWILGMLRPTSIRMAAIALSDLAGRVNTVLKEDGDTG